jgi:hypothetical protein
VDYDWTDRDGVCWAVRVLSVTRVPSRPGSSPPTATVQLAAGGMRYEGTTQSPVDPRSNIVRGSELQRILDEGRLRGSSQSGSRRDQPALSRSALRNHQALSEVLQLARGIIDDGTVTREEAEQFMGWVAAHPEIAVVPPVPLLARRLRGFLSDGILDDREHSEVLRALRELVGDE